MWKGKLAEPLHSMQKFAMIVPDNSDSPPSQFSNVLGLSGPAGAAVVVETIAGEEIVLQCGHQASQPMPKE